MQPKQAVGVSVRDPRAVGRRDGQRTQERAGAGVPAGGNGNSRAAKAARAAGRRSATKEIGSHS